MLEAYILEDESYTLRFLEKIIGDHPRVDMARGFSSSQLLMEAINDSLPDAIFLDIELSPAEAKNGIDIAQDIYARNPEINLVFITGYSRYAIDSFSVHPYDYLLKPLNKDKLARILHELADKKESQLTQTPVFVTSGKTVIKTGDGLAFIDWDDVFFVEKQGRRALIHTDRGICKVRCVLGELEPILPPQFIQAHKSYLINRDKIYRIKDQGNQSFEVLFYGYERMALMSRAKFREYHADFTPSL